MPCELEYTLNKMRSLMDAAWRWGEALRLHVPAISPIQCIITCALGVEGGYSLCDIVMGQTVVGACAIIQLIIATAIMSRAHASMPCTPPALHCCPLCRCWVWVGPACRCIWVA